MSLPLRCDVHAVAVRRSFLPAGGPASGVAVPGGGALQTALVAASVLQAVYACAQDDAVLAVVRLQQAPQSCTTAQPDQAAPVLGVILRKPSPTAALVVSLGPVDGFADLTPGARYFLAPDGALCCPPLDPQKTPYVHPVGLAVSASQLFVMPQWPIVKRSL